MEIEIKDFTRDKSRALHSCFRVDTGWLVAVIDAPSRDGTTWIARDIYEEQIADGKSLAEVADKVRAFYRTGHCATEQSIRCGTRPRTEDAVSGGV